jgi:hypothetical protein
MRRQADAAGEPQRPCSPSRLPLARRQDRLRKALDELSALQLWNLQFISLTLPGDPSLKEVRAAMDRLRRAMKHRYGDRPAVWVAELQERGVSHRHLVYPSKYQPSELEEWLRPTWYRIVDDDNPCSLDMRPADTGATGYLLKIPDVCSPEGEQLFGQWGDRVAWRSRTDLA